MEPRADEDSPGSSSTSLIYYFSEIEMAWTIQDLKNKAECYKDDQIGRYHPYVLASCQRSDDDMHDISKSEFDYTWAIVSCITGGFFVQNLEPHDMIKLLNALEFEPKPDY